MTEQKTRSFFMAGVQGVVKTYEGSSVELKQDIIDIQAVLDKDTLL